jgi:hypothetical protein
MKSWNNNQFLKYNLILYFVLFVTISFSQNKLNFKLDDAFNNSASRYCYRSNGSWNGCIGEFPDCEAIPLNEELIKAIISLKKDYNQDKIISGLDLEYAIEKSLDLNDDGKKDIFDLSYSFKKLNFIEGTEYYVVAKIIKHPKYNGIAIQLSEPHDVYIFDPTNNAEIPNLKESRSIILLTGNLVDEKKYLNKNILLKGKYNSGITQNYIDGLMFNVSAIIGIIK